MAEEEALALTALVGDKGGDYYRCGGKGNSLVSAMFVPAELRMFAAF